MTRPIAVWLAVAAAGLTTAVAVRSNTFVAFGTDQSAYIEAAHRWSTGRLATPSPLQFWSSWRPTDYGVVPFGFRVGVTRGTDVSEYPLGLPVFMAAAIRLGGPLAAYLVVPFCAGLLVWCGYRLGACLGGSWAGLLAATMLAASPLTLAFAVQPMSDVPAAALWALAWISSLRPGLGAAAASGATAAAAMMVRPNLAPFVLVLIPLLLARRDLPDRAYDDQRGRRVGLFLGIAALGPLLVGWSQYELYGSPFRPGYLGADDFYRLARIPANLGLHPRLMMLVHTPLIFAGLLVPAVLWLPAVRARVDARARAVALSAASLVFVNYAVYLPYLPIDGLGALRFVLPAFAPLCVLLAGLLVHLARALASMSRFLAPLALVPAIIVSASPSSFVRAALNLRHEQARVLVAGRYLREVLPANAAILTGAQSGGIAHYTGRPIIRLDQIHPTALDGVIDAVARRGYRPVLVLDQRGELAWFQAHFAPSPLHALDWPPRAEIADVVRIVYLDPADRAAYQQGQRWTTDVLSAR